MAKADKPKDSASDAAAPPKEGEKLQKVLARTGLGSRREMERWIEQGRITIDGKLASLGDRVGAEQRIEVDGRPLAAGDGEKTRCMLYHKPTGEVCSRKDPEGRRTVFERLPKVKSGRWISIGRLDYNTSGLLLFTTDGELANALMHPSANIEREYMVRVMGDVTEEAIKAMLEGVMLDDGVARFTDIQSGGGDGINTWYYVVLMEGRNREVRRLWESQGLTVSRLKRVRYGDLLVPSKVKQGQYQELATNEINGLYRMAGMPTKDVAPPSREDRSKHKRMEGKRGRVRGNKSPVDDFGSRDARKDARKDRPTKGRKSGSKSSSAPKNKRRTRA
ncbi:MAG: 23S rRNA pseudouridine2605 synthase [Glaciecola sp.]|jgi:23S rRNA pseudouridine2605 synthase|uniref:23S rRNA pseudouridine(2605) synthase RluB n=1 Tax=Congregibacter sp. TaxID=2744308 RepID=UPI0039E385E0